MQNFSYLNSQDNNAMTIFMMSVFGNDYCNTQYPNNFNFNNNNYNNNNFNNNNFNINYQNNNNVNNNAYYQNKYNDYFPNDNNSWKQGYIVNKTPANTPKQPTPDQMYNCVFKTTQGFTFNIPFSAKRTIKDLVETFFKRVDREDLINKNVITMLFNAAKIPFESKDKIISLFRNNINPIIMVLDVQNLIGA